VAAALIAVVLFSVPSIGGEIPVAEANPTLQPVPSLAPMLLAVINVYGAGYPKNPDGSTTFDFWVYNTGNLDAQNVKVHLWFIAHSKADPNFNNDYHSYVTLPKVRAGDSVTAQIQCNVTIPLYCSSAIAEIQPNGTSYAISKQNGLASLSIPH
jgi:hypothetical protein